MYYAGIDLGKRKSHIKVITADRKVVEDLKIDNDPKEFARIFRKYKGKIVAGCEATSNAFWVADTIEPLVEKVLVKDAREARLDLLHPRIGPLVDVRNGTSGRDIKTDSLDPEVVEVAPEASHERGVLLLDRPVPVVPTPVVHGLNGPREREHGN